MYRDVEWCRLIKSSRYGNKTYLSLAVIERFVNIGRHVVKCRIRTNMTALLLVNAVCRDINKICIIPGVLASAKLRSWSRRLGNHSAEFPTPLNMNRESVSVKRALHSSRLLSWEAKLAPIKRSNDL